MRFKMYLRGLIMHVGGIASMSMAMYLMGAAFVVGSDTLTMIILGSGIVFVSYGIFVCDCVRIVRSKSKHFVKA